MDISPADGRPPKTGIVNERPGGLDDRPARRPAPLWLWIVTVLETLSLAVLLLNVTVLHARSVASVIGPIHGVLYLVTIVSVCALPTPVRARIHSVVPAIGGLLAVRTIDRAARGTRA